MFTNFDIILFHYFETFLNVRKSFNLKKAKINELDNREEKTLKDLREHLDKPDIVIVEGFKKENHKKIEIISNNSLEDQYLFPNLKNVFCIISDKQINTSITQFKINEIKNIANYILEKI